MTSHLRLMLLIYILCVPHQTREHTPCFWLMPSVTQGQLNLTPTNSSHCVSVSPTRPDHSSSPLCDWNFANQALFWPHNTEYAPDCAQNSRSMSWWPRDVWSEMDPDCWRRQWPDPPDHTTGEAVTPSGPHCASLVISSLNSIAADISLWDDTSLRWLPDWDTTKNTTWWHRAKWCTRR